MPVVRSEVCRAQQRRWRPYCRPGGDSGIGIPGCQCQSYCKAQTPRHRQCAGRPPPSAGAYHGSATKRWSCPGRINGGLIFKLRSWLRCRLSGPALSESPDHSHAWFYLCALPSSCPRQRQLGAIPHVVDGPYVPFRTFGSSLYHMYITLLGRSRPTHTRPPAIRRLCSH